MYMCTNNCQDSVIYNVKLLKKKLKEKEPFSLSLN